MEKTNTKKTFLTLKSLMLGSAFLMLTNAGAQISFERVEGTPFPAVSDGAFAFADIDGNGTLDLLITGRAGGATSQLFSHDGNGNFTKLSNTGIADIYFGTVDFFDMNGNGFPDLLLTGVGIDEEPMAAIYFNDGTGKFTRSTASPITGVGASAVAVADVNGDGHMDFIAAGMNADWGLSTNLYINDGNGKFTPSSNSFEGIWHCSMEFSDVDGDGDLDLLMVGETFNEKVAFLYLNDGNGNFSLKSGAPFIGLGASAMSFADVNGDGVDDVLITGFDDNDDLKAQLFINDGNRNFELKTGAPFQGVYDGSVSFADVDGDGDMDVLITGAKKNQQSLTHLHINDGNGNFTLSNFQFPSFARDFSQFTDINGDGKPDLLMSGITSGGKSTVLFINTSTLSIKGHHFEQISLFPNPSTGIFTIRTAGESLSGVTVYSVLGQMVLTQKTSESEIQIDLTAQPAGIYFAQVGNKVFKLVKE